MMDLSHYSIQKPRIALWIDARPDCDLLDEAGKIACAYHVHIVVVLCFIGELRGFTSEILSKIERDMSYYHISEIKGFDMSLLPNSKNSICI